MFNPLTTGSHEPADPPSHRGARDAVRRARGCGGGARALPASAAAGLLLVLCLGSGVSVAAPFDTLDADRRAEVADRCLPMRYARDPAGGAAGGADGDRVRECLVRVGSAGASGLSVDERHALRELCGADDDCRAREREALEALDRDALLGLPTDERDAVHRHCRTVQDSDGPVAWHGCLQTAVASLSQGPVLDRQALGFASRRAALSVCTEREPGAYRRCLQEAGMPIDTSQAPLDAASPAAAPRPTGTATDTAAVGDGGADEPGATAGSNAVAVGPDPVSRLRHSFDSLDGSGRLLLLAAALLPLLLWVTRRLMHRREPRAAGAGAASNGTDHSTLPERARRALHDDPDDFDLDFDEDRIPADRDTGLWDAPPAQRMPDALSSSAPASFAERSPPENDTDPLVEDADFDRTAVIDQVPDLTLDDMPAPMSFDDGTEMARAGDSAEPPAVDHDGRTHRPARPFESMGDEVGEADEVREVDKIDEAGDGSGDGTDDDLLLDATLDASLDAWTNAPDDVPVTPFQEASAHGDIAETAAGREGSPSPAHTDPVNAPTRADAVADAHAAASPHPPSRQAPDPPSDTRADAPLTMTSAFGSWLGGLTPEDRLTQVVEFFVYWMAYGDRRYDETARQALLDHPGTADGDADAEPPDRAIKRWVLLEDTQAFVDAVRWMQARATDEQRRQTLQLLIALLVSDAIPTPVQNTLLRFLADAFGTGVDALQSSWQDGFGAALPPLPRVDRSDWWALQDEYAMEERDARLVAGYSAAARHAARLGLPLHGPYEAARIRALSRLAIQRTEPERFDALGDRARALASRQLARIEQARDALLTEAID